MARRRKYRYITDPITKASAVIVGFKNKVSKDIRGMQEKYRANLEGYVADVNKQKWVALKLAGYYIGLSDPEVRNAIRSAINKAKEKQAEFIAPYVQQLPPAGVTEDVKSLATAVVSIIRGTPTPAPAV